MFLFDSSPTFRWTKILKIGWNWSLSVVSDQFCPFQSVWGLKSMRKKIKNLWVLIPWMLYCSDWFRHEPLKRDKSGGKTPLNYQRSGRKLICRCDLTHTLLGEGHIYLGWVGRIRWLWLVLHLSEINLCTNISRMQSAVVCIYWHVWHMHMQAHMQWWWHSFKKVNWKNIRK